jgi:hypothetical protein
MSDLAKICLEKGVKVDPKAAIDQKTFDILVDLENLYEALDITKKGAKVIKKLMGQGDAAKGIKPLSAEGKQIVYTVFGQYKNEPAWKIFNRAIDKRKNEGPADSRLTDIEVMAAIVEAAKKVETNANKYLVNLSAYAKRMHKALRSNVSVTKGIELTIGFLKRKIPLRHKATVNAIKNAARIKALIKKICLKRKWVKPKVVKPRVVKPIPKPKSAWQKFLAKTDWSLRLSGGYGYRISGHQNLSVLAGEGRGVLAQGGISAAYKFNDRYRLQLDYRTNVPIEVAGQHKDDLVVSNLDDVRLSAFMNPLKQLALFAQVGYIHSRYDYPSERAEDYQHAFIAKLRANIIPSLKYPLSINIDPSFLIGPVNQTFPVETDLAIRFLANAGVSYAFKGKGYKITPFLGGTVGYFAGRKLRVLGGYVGASLVAGNHEANLMALYNNVEGITANARYLYNRAKWGIGARVFYNLYSKDKKLVDTILDTQQTVGGEVFGMWRFARYKRDFEVKLFARGAYETETGASNIFGGFEFRWGTRSYANPSLLRPYSSTPLPEDR